jgi:putative oxidoreductase
MKIAVLIARILLGLGFVVFGANGFLQFMHMPLPGGPAGQFIGAMMASHYFLPVAFFQMLGGALILSGFYVPLGLTVLGPILVNILIFHATMAPAGLPAACVWAILWFIVFAGYRQAFAGIFAQKVPVA